MFYHRVGMLEFNPESVDKIKKEYKRRNMAQAAIYIEKKKDVDAHERNDFLNRTEDVIKGNIKRTEAAMKKIVVLFEKGYKPWKEMYAEIYDDVADTRFGEDLKRWKYYSEGMFPNGKEFSETMKELTENNIIPEIENKLTDICCFIREYIWALDSTKE